MENEDLCRCCHIEFKNESHANLFTKNILSDQTEVYAVMIKECFGITLNQMTINGICDTCIQSVRTSLNFKHQVVWAEEKLLQRLKGNPVQNNSKSDSSIIDKDKIKAFFRESKSSRIKNIRNKIKSSKVEWIESSNTHKERNNENNGTQDQAFINHKFKIKKRGKLYTNPAAKTPKYTTYPGEENRKDIIRERNRHNLKSMLKYSNIMPFRNKSILGYHCAYCSEAFADPSDLRLHSDKNHGEERLDIINTFDIRNLPIVLEITNLTCTLCGQVLNSLNDLKEHLTTIHDKEFFKEKDHLVPFKLKKDTNDCALCNSTFETYQLLRLHMKIHFTNYTCGHCNTPFITLHTLRIHEAQHIEGSFHCEVCNKMFKTEEKLKAHQRHQHLGIKNNRKCPECNEVLKNTYHRNKHLQDIHHKATPYKCNVCSRNFLLKTVMMDHIKRSHLKEKYYRCLQCDYMAFSKTTLNEHMLKHSCEKKYQCEICSKAYKRKWTLKEHLKIHNNDRQFKCDLCFVAFIQKCSLKSHLLTNHGVSLAASEIVKIKYV